MDAERGPPEDEEAGRLSDYDVPVEVTAVDQQARRERVDALAEVPQRAPAVEVQHGEDDDTDGGADHDRQA
jgi:hypothetical protein